MIASIVHITDITNLASIRDSRQSWEQNILEIVRPTEKREHLFFPKTYGSDNQLKITTKYKVDEASAEVDQEIEQMLFEGLKPNLPASMTYEEFKADEEGKEVGRMEFILHENARNMSNLGRT